MSLFLDVDEGLEKGSQATKKIPLDWIKGGKQDTLSDMVCYLVSKPNRGYEIKGLLGKCR